jgi:hypothetical protein
MFDFDRFVNEPSMAIFGRDAMYRPKNTARAPFALRGDFHESYMDINLKNAGADISAAKIVLFVRLCDFPANYLEPKQGDYVRVNDLEYQVVDIEAHIPGSKKLILHEE